MKHQIKIIVPCFLTIKKYKKIPPSKNSYWTHQLLSMRQAIKMLRQKTVNGLRKLEMVIGINKIGKRIQNKKKIKHQTINRKKENQLSY